ncbi:hypothetical protein AMTRI_Chr05g72900 [Amborella trichopoda]
MEGLNPSPLTGYLAAIETQNGSNFSDWKLKIEITLSILDLDLALCEDEPLKPNNESNIEHKDHIMQMIDITNKLKSMYMEISDGFLYDKFKLAYNNGKKERNCNFCKKKGHLKRNYLKYKKWLENKGIQQQSESH